VEGHGFSRADGGKIDLGFSPWGQIFVKPAFDRRKGEGKGVGFSIEQYAALRPTLWHLTHVDNLGRIRKSRVLMPAEHFVSETLNCPRRGMLRTSSGVVLRDQDLLHESCIDFQNGYSMCDLLADSNRRVFFWAGRPDRPVKAGLGAIKRYGSSNAIIRLSFLAVVEKQTPHFSRYNFGAPRMHHGKRVPRGPKTFVQATECDFPPSKVVEVTFAQPVTLRADAEVARSLDGPWEIL